MSNLLDGISITLTLADRRKKGRRTVDVAKSVEKKATAATAAAAKPATTKPLPQLRFVVENWTPMDRLVYIGTQSCPCCAKKVQYIAGDLIRYFQNDKVAGQRTIRSRAFSATDVRFAHLPRTLEHLPPEEHLCPTCLAAEDIVQEVFCGPQHGLQIPLFL